MEKITKQDLVKVFVWGTLLPILIYFVTNILLTMSFFMISAYAYSHKTNLTLMSVWFMSFSMLIVAYWLILGFLLLIGAASASAGAFQ